MRVFSTLAALLAAPLLASAVTLETVKELNLDAMVVLDTIEKGGYCQTIDYAKTATGISVKNSMNFQIPGGMVMSLEGKVTPNPKEPGKLVEKFDMFPTPVNWWVIKLGPLLNGQYEYLVASDDKGQMLFVLARDVGNFGIKYDEEAVSFAEDNGFMGPRFGPIKTEHSRDCQYAPAPKAAAGKAAPAKKPKY